MQGDQQQTWQNQFNLISPLSLVVEASVFETEDVCSIQTGAAIGSSFNGQDTCL